MTQEELKKVLTYLPLEGVFIRNTSYNHYKIGSITGSINKKGYVHINLRSKTYLAHRLAFLYMEGAFPEDGVDHINGIKSDNRWENIRKCSCSENMANMFNKSSQLPKGVSYNEKLGRFTSEVCHKGNRVTKRFFINLLGKDEALKQATTWVKGTRLSLHGEFSNHG